MNPEPQAPPTPGVEGKPEPTPPEIVHVDGHLHVTVDVAHIPDAQVRFFVGSNLLLVWDHDRPEEVRQVVNLPHSIDATTSIVQVNNGVLDLSAPTDLERDRARGTNPPERAAPPETEIRTPKPTSSSPSPPSRQPATQNRPRRGPSPQEESD